MLFWLTWPVDRLALKLSERRIEEIKESLGGAGYVDEELWSDVRHIREDQAHDELERGVKVGYLERWVLYQDEDEDISFVVPEALKGETIRLSDAGYFSDDEVTIPKYNVKQVYVAAESAAWTMSNVAAEESGTETIGYIAEEGSGEEAMSNAAEEAIGTEATSYAAEEESGAVAISSAADEGNGEEAMNNAAEEA
jgi:hypothetical protein